MCSDKKKAEKPEKQAQQEAPEAEGYKPEQPPYPGEGPQQGFMPPPPHPYMGMYGPEQPYGQPPYGQQPYGQHYGQPYMYMTPPPHPHMNYEQQMPPYGYPQGAPQQPHHGHQGCDGHGSDPFGNVMGMFGEMLDNNPSLSAINKMVGAANNDFLKGAMVGAGVALLLTSDGVKEMLTSIISGSMDIFDKKEAEDE